MAIAFGSAGTGAAGTSSLSVPLPASIAAGDLLVLCVCTKYPANPPSTPSGWQAPAGNNASGGAGSSGVDTGNVLATIFTRVADGSESGNVSVTITGGNAAIGRMLRYTKAAGATWDLAFAGGSDNVGDVSWSVVTGAIDIHAFDMVLAASAVNTEAFGFILEACAQSGTTFGTMTERSDGGTSNGDDVGMFITDHPVSSGGGSGAVTYTATSGGTATDSPAGATVLLRMRESFTSSGTGAMPSFGGSGTADAFEDVFSSSGTGAMPSFGGSGTAEAGEDVFTSSGSGAMPAFGGAGSAASVPAVVTGGGGAAALAPNIRKFLSWLEEEELLDIA